MDYSRFEIAMKNLPDIPAGSVVAAGVSGGPDSMAMLWLLSQWADKQGIGIHAYSVDHGLRPESADEARQVGQWVKDWPRVSHSILNWEGAKPDSRILEEARAARYDLMENAMKGVGTKYLFIAHHADDQAETFLIRLAKGSGLDGLSCMKPVQDKGDGVKIARPLLDWPKDDLVQICRDNKIPYIDDPTNKNDHYLRPRLRAAKDILEEEGLSTKRLCATARRFSRARQALDDMANDLFHTAVLDRNDASFLFDYRALHAAHEELVLRVLLRVMDEVAPEAGYGPRLEKVENLLTRILGEEDFKGATLGGCIFSIDKKKAILSVTKE